MRLVGAGQQAQVTLAPGMQATILRGAQVGPTLWAWVGRGDGDPSLVQALAELRDGIDPRTLSGALGLLLDGPPPPQPREQYAWAGPLAAIGRHAAGIVLLSSLPLSFEASPHVELNVDDEAARRLARGLCSRFVSPPIMPFDRTLVAAPLVAWIDGESDRLSRAVTDRATAALRALLGTLKMTGDRPVAPTLRVVLRKLVQVEGDRPGVAEPTVAPGELVRSGQCVAWLGEPGLRSRRALTAPGAGVVLYTRSGRVQAGPVVGIGKLRRTLPRLAAAGTDAAGAPGVAPIIDVGWCEWAALPEIGIERLKAKIDTGARTSALHAISMRRAGTAPSGRPLYDLELPAGRRGRVISTRVEVVDFTRVRDSGGHLERRPVIETLLELGPVVRQIRVSLTHRGDMLFPMLIGRTALPGEVRVVPDQRFIAT